MTAGVEQRFTADDSETRGETILGFGLTSETRAQSLALSLGARVRSQIGDSFDTRLTDPSLQLDYSYTTRGSTLELSLNYSEEPVINTGGNIGDSPAQVFIGSGTREDSAARLSFTFGQEARFGGALSLGYQELGFSDTEDTSLIPAQTSSAALSLRFDLSSRVTLTPALSVTETTREGGSDVRRERATLGAELTFSEVLTGGLQIGQTRLLEDTEETEGSTATLSLALARPNGTLSTELSSDLSVSGRRTTLRFTRSFEAEISQFTLGLGLSQSETEDLRPLYSLAYTRETERSQFTVSLAQEFAIDSTGNEALNSRLSLGYSTTLSEVMDFTSSLGYARSEILSGTGDETERFDLRLGLSRSLAQDWRLTGGVNFTQTRDGAVEEDQSEVFLGLKREFDWRP